MAEPTVIVKGLWLVADVLAFSQIVIIILLCSLLNELRRRRNG